MAAMRRRMARRAARYGPRSVLTWPRRSLWRRILDVLFRRRRTAPPPRPQPPGPPEAGTREPLRPKPFAGAGAASIPEPED